MAARAHGAGADAPALPPWLAVAVAGAAGYEPGASPQRPRRPSGPRATSAAGPLLLPPRIAAAYLHWCHVTHSGPGGYLVVRVRCACAIGCPASGASSRHMLIACRLRA
jgi:hypothetical protein